MKIKNVILVIVVAFAAMIGFSGSASAANSVALSCSPTTISIVGGVSDTALCTVSITTDATISTASITLDSSEYLLISGVKANSAWTYSPSKTAEGTYGFWATNGTVPAGTYELFSFNLTLSEKVANIEDPEENCGELCIKGATFDNATGSVSGGKNTCFAPQIEIAECTGKDCEKPNPETGAFTNVLLIGAAVVAAGVVIVFARRGSKFYRV